MSFARRQIHILLFTTLALCRPQSTPENGEEIIFRPNLFKNSSDGDVGARIILRGFQGCEEEDPCNPDLDKKAAIKKGFEDMQVMIPMVDVVDPSDPPENAYNINWEDAVMVEYFGNFQKTGSHRRNVQGEYYISTTGLRSWS